MSDEITMTPAQERETPLADRGIPQVGRRRPASHWGWLLLIALAILLAVALGIQVMLSTLRDRRGETARPMPAVGTLPNLTRAAFDRLNPPAEVPSPPQPGLPPANTAIPPAPPAEPTPEEKEARERARRRLQAPVLVKAGMGTAHAVEGSAASPNHDDPSTGTSTLSSALSATRNAATSASILPHPDLVMTQGMFADCILQTAIDSTLPGMTSCVLDRNLYSTTGRVLLLERGSRVVGQYQSGQLRAGMKRIFVLWTRIETPKGVLVSLESPGTDALGRSGLDGHIETHFWERFGAALLVSVVDDLTTAAAQRRDSATVSLNATTNTPRDAAAVIVENSSQIPPTLDRAQGAHINIVVARDLHFDSVYELVAAQPPHTP